MNKGETPLPAGSTPKPVGVASVKSGVVRERRYGVGIAQRAINKSAELQRKSEGIEHFQKPRRRSKESPTTLMRGSRGVDLNSYIRGGSRNRRKK